MKKNSFTILEAIFAISILTVGIFGVSSLISQFLTSSSISNQRLIAAYLAQEGIEIVRNIRDTNLLEGESLDAGLTNCSSGCSNFDYRSQSLPDNSNCSGKNFLDLVNNFYQCSGSSPASLKRIVTITQINNPPGLKVVVEVSWKERGRTHRITVQENFYNWY
jgi:Tfp pilus assembly protein PilV